MKKCQYEIIIIILLTCIFFIYLFNSTLELTPSPRQTQIQWIETKDVLRNPYDPPLSNDSPFLFPPLQGRMPINISTNPGAVDASYRQVGILTPQHSARHHSSEKNRIIPLMGRPLVVSRNKWQYYTMTDKTNSIKLPILYKGRSCTNEYGCDELVGGEHVYVEGYEEAFKVTKYDNDTIRYIPIL